MPPSPDPLRPTTLRLDAGAIRVLAHPLRSRLLTALRTDGPATATALAHALATNTGATSYHLRRLASVGLVEETDEGRGRERWWRAASAAHAWRARDVEGDPDARAASEWLEHHYLAWFTERYEAWLEARAAWPLDWREAAETSDALVHVTADRLAALQAELLAVVARYQDADPGGDRGGDPDPGGDADPDESARRVIVVLHAFPMDPIP
jgi:predicted ArsR family transcriptional regulator